MFQLGSLAWLKNIVCYTGDFVIKGLVTSGLHCIEVRIEGFKIQDSVKLDRFIAE